MQGILNFYGTLIEFKIPETYSEFKNSLSKELVMDISDVEELIIKYKMNGQYKFIKQENYSEFLVNATDKITLDVEINENSRIFAREKEKIINESIIQQNPEEFPQNEMGRVVSLDAMNKEENLEMVSQYCSSTTHYGVMCNECYAEPIVGIRYKCSICDCYNLCEDCEKKKGELHNHPFIKIRIPEKR